MRSLRTLCVRFSDDERGSVLPLVGLCMVVILGFAAVAIDLGQQHALETQLEGTADAAALAAATQLPDEKKARKKALEYVEKNMPAAANGTVLDDADVLFGTWYAHRREFVVGGPVINAVQVTVRRSDRNGNPAPRFFLHIFGQEHADLSAQSLAGIVFFDDPAGGDISRLGEADRAKFKDMQEALQKEFEYRWKKSSRHADDVMDDKDVAEFLMENFGRTALLR